MMDLSLESLGGFSMVSDVTMTITVYRIYLTRIALEFTMLVVWG